ncbi:MAG: tRNA uridine-5-carboxymethylaminomethyl(34) synthesis GTPase MnmE, partial [Planctomycetota bacterium]
MRDTIAAIASPPGPARRGVIRLSGARAAELVAACVRVDRGALARDADGARPSLGARALFHGWFDDGGGTQPVLVLWMPGPRSYTREDVAELHLVGAEPLLAAALRRLLELGARAARPGEFTRRAFEHGRIDLSRAEGVLELVSASSDAERRAALALLSGGLEQRIAPLRERLADARALAEAALDFAEGDTGDVPAHELCALVLHARDGLARTLEFEVARVALPALPRVLLVGAPNAGKSSLYNALVGAERALVAPIAGTTRDWLAARWNAAGVEVELVDTPGLDPAAAGIDRAAQQRAAELVATAALCVWTIDAGAADGAA